MDRSSFGGPSLWNQESHPHREIIHIGCAGWNIPRQSAAHFESAGTHLERYSRTFNCCEINSSFYRPHKYSTWERWSASVPKDFRFSVKIPRTITHEVELKCKPEDLTAFLKPVRFLGQKLGALLVQLPPRCVFDYLIAKRFFVLLRELHDGDVVLEARHETWFDARADDLLKRFSIAGVAADPACVPVAGQPTGYEQMAYFRLHGSPRRYYSAYSRKFLDAMATQLADLARRARVWCIFDNTAAGFATSNALQLNEAQRRRLNALPNIGM
jgi:uncharacterized protein YecE (DUF72 family)